MSAAKEIWNIEWVAVQPEVCAVQQMEQTVRGWF